MGVRGEERKFSAGSGGGSMISLEPCENHKSSRNDESLDENVDESRVTYATIDSLALKGARLPLRLLPITIDDKVGEDDPRSSDPNWIFGNSKNRENPTKRSSFKVRSGSMAVPNQRECRTRSSGTASCPLRVATPETNEGFVVLDDPNREISETSRSSIDETSKFSETRQIVQDEECSDGVNKIPPSIEYRITRNEIEKKKTMKKMKKKKKKWKKRESSTSDKRVLKIWSRTGSEDLIVKRTRHCEPKFTFAKSVFNYVPISNRRTGKKKIVRGELSLSKNREGWISLPTNFVHLASATSSKLLPDVPISEDPPETNIPSDDLESDDRCVPEVVKISENEGNCDETTPDAPVYEAMSEISIDSRYSTVTANTSFLWGNGGGASGRTVVSRSFERNGSVTAETFTEKEIFNDTNSVKTPHSIDLDYEVYDDVGPWPRADAIEEDDYDDVGLPFTTETRSTSIRTLFEEMNLDNDDLQLYDDVAPRPVPTSGIPSSHNLVVNESINEIENLEKKHRDDFDRNGENSSIDNDYSSVEKGHDDFEDETYDDVQLPSQDRVNSLYAGSLNNGKESEWEDLEDASAISPAPALPLPKKNNTISRNIDSQNSSGKKKSAHHGRSRKVVRRRSRASRKNRPIGRSTSRAPMRTETTSTFSDTASDDSNYETLFSSFPSDEFSSEDENDESNENSWTVCNNNNSPVEPIAHQEAPSRPVPPPPRESSLTETFGKRIKMLRRTWSITKGSLGRMRRRTWASNVESDTSNIDDRIDECTNCQRPQRSTTNDSRKYFSFKKHFGKTVTGLSTFYLETNDERLSRSDNCPGKEEIYSNSSSEFNRYANTTEYWKSSGNDVDHYSALDEEPLYQFYAAAAARVAFESDSEGYEEVEDPMPSPSTVDLAKPGQRTLWCQTPGVVNSGLLQRLTPDEKKCQEAKFEILTSEASYLNSLRVLVDEFLNNHDLIYEILTPSEREKLFGGVPSVLMASEKLLAQLEAVWRQDSMLRGLPELLLDYAKKSSSVYVAYCSNQVSIDATLKQLRSRKGSRFNDAITRIESHSACQSLSLHSFLMLPMQRVTRLPLLADAVLSKLPTDNKEERKLWECALSHLSQVVMECNEGARAAGRLAEMEALERKLEYSSKVPPIVLRDRYLIRRGPVLQMIVKSDADYKLTFGKKYHKASLYLLLLMDHLLIAKPKSSTNGETYTVIDTCKRNLVELEKVSEDSPFAGRNAMLLTLLENYSGRHIEYILTCNNATERERWLDAFSPPKPSLVGESLYETWDCPQVMALYPYAAAQPDELTVQPGDVINVLRKMTDGWYLGEKLLGGEQGWFPGNYAKEVASEHVRARNLRQRHRLLALSTSVLQQRAKHASR